jgi:hypothetical protein
VKIDAALLVFRCLPCTPSKECSRRLLPKLGLAQFTAMFWWLADDWHLAFDIFDTAPTHKTALLYSLPICPTSHDAD